MNPISVGTNAPDFTVKDNKNQDILLSAYRGKKFFFPGIL
jgi:peroxiredoxin